MKIRVALMTSEEWEKTSIQMKQAYQELRFDPRNQYIELEVGEFFDSWPPEAREPIEFAVGEFSRTFANRLLGALSFDYSLRLQGTTLTPGLNAIAAGLDEMENQLRMARLLSNPGQGS